MSRKIDLDQLSLFVEDARSGLRPMWPDTGDRLFESSDFAFEPILDGPRCFALVALGQAALATPVADFTSQLPELERELLTRLPEASVIDGFLGWADQERPIRELHLALSAGEPANGVIFSAFDTLMLAGRRLTRHRLSSRRRALARALRRTPGELIRQVPFWPDGEAAWAEARQASARGLVARRLSSHYLPGRRSPDWIELSEERAAKLVVIGWIDLGADLELLLAFEEGAHLRICCSVPVPDSAPEQAWLRSRLEGLRQLLPALHPVPLYGPEIHWVRPELVVAVRHEGWTPAGGLRFASFAGCAAGSEPRDCVRPVVVAAPAPAGRPRVRSPGQPELLGPGN